MKIEITKDDIINGQRQACRLCPAALAIKRALNTKFDVVVVPGYVRILTELGRTAQWLSSPDALVRFVRRFDIGMPVEPISFELPIDQEYVRCASS